MLLTGFSDWLNTFFAGYDHAILSVLHGLANVTGGYLNWLFRLISLFGDKGLFLITLSIFLMLFKKTRKVGICMFGAIGCGAIITNFIVKDMVARPRPFMDAQYSEWWKYVGSVVEDDFSFPSGHTTVITASMMSIFFFSKSKKKYWCLLFIILMGISRNYLMVHYPSDILGGFLSGLIASVIAFYITKLIYVILDKYDNKVFKFIKEFDIVDCIRKKKHE